MTTEDHLEQLKKLQEVAKNKILDDVILPAANELLAVTKNRIQVEGKGSDGNSIGNYSTKPGYYSREQFINKGSFKPQGKTGKKTKSTMYLPAGYKEFRDIQGRQTKVINETLTGDTMLSYQLGREPNAVVLGMVNERASNIRKGQEKKFGKIFSQTTEEMDDYKKNVQADINEINQQVFNA